MWLDRLSGHSTPSITPPQNRSQSPAPHKPSHLAPATASRPGLSPRSSSLNVAKFNASTASLTSPRLPNGSSLKQQILPPEDYRDPLKVLEDITGNLFRDESPHKANDGALEKPEVLEDIDFGGSSLDSFLDEGSLTPIAEADGAIQSAKECEYVYSYGITRFLY